MLRELLFFAMNGHDRTYRKMYGTPLDLHNILLLRSLHNEDIGTFQSCHGHQEPDTTFSQAHVPYIQFYSPNKQQLTTIDLLSNLYNAMSSTTHHLRLIEGHDDNEKFLLFGTYNHNEARVKLLQAQLDMYRLWTLVTLIDTTIPSVLPSALHQLSLSFLKNDLDEIPRGEEYGTFVRNQSKERNDGIANITPHLLVALNRLQSSNTQPSYTFYTYYQAE